MANIDSKELSVKDFMHSLMSGVLSDDIIESYVLALNEKGVTAENIFDAAIVMRQFSKQVVIQDGIERLRWAMFYVGPP